jgi:C1A family cysteine protease
VRNQGQRGTCVAHACSAVREYLTGPAGPAADFSEQHLYWNCKAHDLLPGAGTFIRVGMSRLQEDGVAGEADWPYNPNVIPGNEGHGPPPAGLEGRAAANKIQSYTTLAATSVPALRQALADGSPIAFAVPVYNSWFSAPANTTGDIRLPLPGEKSAGGHAMCMVGYETDPDVPGGGFFLVRNSWGTGWAGQNPTAPGHARLPFAYIEKHGKSAYIAYAPGEAVKPKTLGQRLLDWLRGLFG